MSGFGGKYSLGRLAAQTTLGCANAEFQGGDCGNGAAMAFGTGAAAWVYNNSTGYDADLRPGRDPKNPIYTPDVDNGMRQPRGTFGDNVTGINEAGHTCSQGTDCSRLLNKLPFVNATAGLHDWVFNSAGMPATGNTVANVITMGTSAVVAIPASLSSSSTWFTPKQKESTQNTN